MNDQYANGEGDTMQKNGVSADIQGPSSKDSLGVKMNLKPIKTPGSRGITRKRGLPKRSMGMNYKK
jgi:hypothetical protein